MRDGCGNGVADTRRRWNPRHGNRYADVERRRICKLHGYGRHEQRLHGNNLYNRWNRRRWCAGLVRGVFRMVEMPRLPARVK